MSAGRRILIVGGNSGIGAAIHATLAVDHEVIRFSRSGTPAVDVTLDEPALPEIDGPLHGLVYCPGSINLKSISALGIDDFRRDLDVNLLGAVRVVKRYLPNLKASGDASIVFFSTVAVQTGMAFHCSVAAAKGAVEGLTRSLAAELAPGIRVNAVAPSLTATPLAQGLLRSDRQREAATGRHPMKRLGRPEDAAAAACFLLTEAGSWVTGQVLAVDGGLSALRGA